MARDSSAWVPLATGAAMLAGAATRRGLAAGWRAWRKREPPLDPRSADVAWADALLWAALTGAVVGLMRLVARRGAAAGWRRLKGRHPRASALGLWDG